MLDQLGAAKYFSLFHLASGFYQIPMKSEDAPKITFSTSRILRICNNSIRTSECGSYLPMPNGPFPHRLSRHRNVRLSRRHLTEHLIKFKKLAQKTLGTTLNFNHLSVSSCVRKLNIWQDVITNFLEKISEEDVTITICLQLVQVPEESERLDIINENHTSALADHKGVPNTYNPTRLLVEEHEEGRRKLRPKLRRLPEKETGPCQN